MLNRSFLSDMWHFWSAKLNTHQGRSSRTLAVYTLAVPWETTRIDCCRLMTTGFIAQCPSKTHCPLCMLDSKSSSFTLHDPKIGMMEEDPTYSEDTKREYKWFICFCLICEALAWITNRKVIEDRCNGFEGQEEESLPSQWSDKKSLSLCQENNLKKYLNHNPWMRSKKLLFIHGMNKMEATTVWLKLHTFYIFVMYIAKEIGFYLTVMTIVLTFCQPWCR